MDNISFPQAKAFNFLLCILKCDSQTTTLLTSFTLKNKKLMTDAQFCESQFNCFPVEIYNISSNGASCLFAPGNFLLCSLQVDSQTFSHKNLQYLSLWNSNI